MSKFMRFDTGSSDILVLGCACTACSGSISSTAKHQGDFTSVTFGPATVKAVSATAVPSELLVDGTINGGGFDTYSVDLVAGQTYLFSARGTGVNALGDTFLYLFNGTPSDATLIDIDDDGGDGVNSLLTYTAETSGTYFVGVGAYPGSGLTGTYTFEAIASPGEDTVSDTFVNATAISADGTTFGFIDSGTSTRYGDGLSEIDTYSLQVEAGRYYTIEMAGGFDYLSGAPLPPGELDPVLVLYGPAGQIVVSNDDISGSDLNARISFLATESGTYYLDAFSYAPLTGGYTITSQQIDLATADPLDSLDWENANDVPFVDVSGTPTAYVYFGDSDENFGQTADDGSPMVTIDWNDYEKGQVMLALDEYEKILGTNYVVTTDVNQATFRLLKTESQEYGAYFFPQDPAYGDSQGVGVFNVLSGGWSFDRQQSLEKGGYSFAVILHEFGHAHGLAHPHDNGGGSDIMLGVNAPTGSYGVFNLNQGVYTVMSYNDGWDFHPDGPSTYNRDNIDNGWSGTLSAFDIAQLQVRYGVHEYNQGNTVYTLTDSVEDAFYQTIWDSGGTDEIRYSGTLNANIDLLAATLDYSPTGGGVVSYLNAPAGSTLRGGYTIANGVVIENATGGSGADTLIGNDAANRLIGNDGDDTFVGRGGNDTINGGTGNDTVVLTGNRADYMITKDGDRYTVIDRQADRDGTDTITGIESWRFADGTLASFQLAATNLVRGGAGADDLRGNANSENLITGREGNDILRGGKLDDVLIGGGDDDQMYGGAGADQFRFYGDQIVGTSDRDRLYDLNFGEGDQLLFGTFAAGTFADSANVNAFAGGTSAIIGSLEGLREADIASDLVTVTRQSARSNNLILTVSTGGQTQELVISNIWASYAAANGLSSGAALV